MKILILFILSFSLSSPLLACGMTTSGEFTRYSFLKPDLFQLQSFHSFYYSVDQYNTTYYSEENPQVMLESNIYDWWHYTHKKVSLNSIQSFMQSGTFSSIHPKTDDSFIQYLYQTKNLAAIQYLKVAKNLETYTDMSSERNWEKPNEYSAQTKDISLDLLYAKEKNLFLKRKYAFLAVRINYYFRDQKQLSKFYDWEFRNSKTDYLFYWANFYQNLLEPSPNRVEVARIFSKSPEKRFASYYYFHENFNFKSTLEAAKTNEDKASVLAYNSVQKLDKNLDQLQQIYRLNPKNEVFCFLVLREVNKLEDWVFSPYYTYRLPAIENHNLSWDSEDKITTNILLKRAEEDRIYATPLLHFVQSIDLRFVQNPKIILAAEIQLLFISKNYERCLEKIKSYKAKYSHDASIEAIDKINCLAQIGRQAYGQASIPKNCFPILEKYITDEKFLFALGRELENKGNLTDALALISIKKEENYYDDGTNSSSWQANYKKTSDNLIFLTDYFDYVDYVYTSAQLQSVINKLESLSRSQKSSFIYSNLFNDLDYLKDLLGTKYFRENKLIAARNAFRSTSKGYWEENYNLWERGRYEDNCFDKNPFFSLPYTEDFIYKRDTFLVTKLSVVEHLIDYMYKAEKTGKGDYYYFIIATAYQNFTKHGNSWMLRRFYATENYNREDVHQYIDDKEYRQSLLAQYFYRKAYEKAKSNKMKALCLRMIDYAKDNIDSDFPLKNKDFPNQFGDLGSCIYLQDYFVLN